MFYKIKFESKLFTKWGFGILPKVCKSLTFKKYNVTKLFWIYIIRFSKSYPNLFCWLNFMYYIIHHSVNLFHHLDSPLTLRASPKIDGARLDYPLTHDQISSWNRFQDCLLESTDLILSKIFFFSYPCACPKIFLIKSCNRVAHILGFQATTFTIVDTIWKL